MVGRSGACNLQAHLKRYSKTYNVLCHMQMISILVIRLLCIEGNGEETAGFTLPDPLMFKIGVNDIITKSSVVMISYIYLPKISCSKF